MHLIVHSLDCGTGPFFEVEGAITYTALIPHSCASGCWIVIDDVRGALLPRGQITAATFCHSSHCAGVQISTEIVTSATLYP